jgi:hypothetical protein
VSVGPQYGTVDAGWIKDAAREALRGIPVKVINNYGDQVLKVYEV